MSLFFGLLMFICIVPTVLIMFFQIYPKNWKEKKLVLGLKNRDEFKQDPTAETVDKIVKRSRTRAGIITIATCVISVLLLFLRGMIMQTTVWTAFVFLVIFLIVLPYVLGNRELKDLKRKLGLGDAAGVAYVDLSTAGAVHALNPVRVWIPAVAGLIFVALALLVDLGIIMQGKVEIAGLFLITSSMIMFWLISLMMVAFAYVADNMKNEVVSADSTVNANYNRAKKKIFVDLFVIFLWVNTALLACWLAMFTLFYSESVTIVSITVYMLVIFIAIALFVRKSKMVDALYEKEMKLLADDDDHWLFGLLYYNPADSRLNVEKRAGIGMTVNMGHPVGKVITGIAGLIILGVAVMLVWLGMCESTPMSLRYENDTVICHHLKDEYSINADDIKSVELGENVKELKLVRNFGFGTITIQKGDFTVDGKSGCTVFLWMETGNYIKIVTDKEVYYINGASEAETAEVYKNIKR